MDVMIEGRRYAPVDEADTLHVWYMHDNHTFSRLDGNTLDELVSQADALQSSYGMLCPAILLYGEKETRRVGRPAHRGALGDLRGWNAACKQWKTALRADPLVMKLVLQRKAAIRTESDWSAVE